MELIFGALIALILVVLAARPELLGEDNERVWVNHLADESRKRKAPGTRRPCRYVQAGWRPGQ
ncbi:MAG: hypothetical protein II008_13900 [Oscillospiraceae bacterium]|nr:hypothetical protein [Oscillospiraceae bacterium]